MNKPCGCKVIYIPVGPGAQPIVNPLEAIDFCPLHRAAPAMLEALKEIKEAAEVQMDLSPRSPRPLYHKITAIIAKVEGC